MRPALPFALALALVASRARADAPPSYADAIGVEVSGGFAPYANDVPLSAAIVARVAAIHEPWLRAGVMLAGDDSKRGYVLAGYRVALQPGETCAAGPGAVGRPGAACIRPLVGALGGVITDTCGHDAAGRMTCTGAPLGLFAAMGGVRVEPERWLGIAAQLALGVDTLGNPFGFVELEVQALLPLS